MMIPANANPENSDVMGPKLSPKSPLFSIVHGPNFGIKLYIITAYQANDDMSNPNRNSAVDVMYFFLSESDGIGYSF